jgi:SAP domain
MAVRMRHPDLEGTEISVPSESVPHHANAGWYAVEGQADMGETFPLEAQRFEGQPQVRMRHPRLGEGQVITVAESAVPWHRAEGWLVIGEEAVEEAGVGAHIQEVSLDDLTAEQLRELARDQGVPVSGTKAELLERLGSQEAPAEPAPTEEA